MMALNGGSIKKGLHWMLTFKHGFRCAWLLSVNTQILNWRKKMTREEFNNTRFGTGMKASYDNVVYEIFSVDFTEGLLGLLDTEDPFDDVFWVRCENVDLV